MIQQSALIDALAYNLALVFRIMWISCNMTIRKISFLLFCWFFSFSAYATDSSKLQLNGMASYWSGATEVYIAALLVEKTANNAQSILDSQQSKRMDIRITAKQWRERNIEREWRAAIGLNNSASVNEQFDKDLLAFYSLFKGPLLEGDRLVIDYTPKKAELSLNGVQLMVFAKPEFFNVLLRTWLGPQPPYASFPDQILGKDNGALAELQTRFRAANASVSRRAEVEQWLMADSSQNQASFDGEEVEVAKNMYRLEMTRSIMRKVIYPSRSLRAKESGTSLVKVRLDNKGSLLSSVIQESSGAENLDAAAMKAIEHTRFAHFPAAVSDTELEFLVPVRFVLP